MLESRLGKGGMGEVWQARHLETNERVAVKVMLEELAQDSALQKRFLREARAAAAVRHPNVVELREVQEGDDGAPFLVMELLEGETLGRRLKRRGALSIAEAAAIMLPVFDAVEAAHAAGLVHRDLKPENIFLARERDGHVRVCVLDFGIAKQVEKLAAPTTSASAETTAAPATTASMLGTPYYMAPEQALGEKNVDGLADVWSLGVILYECLSGKRPTEAATLGAILKIIVTDGVVPLWEVLPGVDGALAGAVMRMLRTSREERAPSLAEIRGELVAQLPPTFVLEAFEAEGAPASVPHVPARMPASTPPGPTKKPRSRLLALAAVALATVGAVLAARGLGGESPAARVTAPSSSVASSAPSAVASVARPLPATTDLAPPSSAPALATASSRPSAAVASAHARPLTPTATPTPTATATPTGGPGRGPSGLVTDNPFAPPPPSAPRP